MKITAPQEKMLRKICATNGGGMSVPLGGNELQVMRRLEAKELIQGKLNGDGRAVHTRQGWDLIKELDKSE